MQAYDREFINEKYYSDFVVKQIEKYKSQLEKSLNYMGEENLRKLRELRDDAESNPTDLFVFIEQLHAQNQAFNFKDKFKQLEELGYLLNEPYFSRIDLSAISGISSESRKIYIGRFGLTPFEKNEPLITDWRAKIAAVYYKYRYPQKNVEYDTEEGKKVCNLDLKRTFEFDSGDLLKYYNNDIQLDENEIISEKAAKRTGGVLEDIVATIQKSQMDIIEQDPRGVCIVQGCVGSGKSTVAIHKLSHIFFNYPNLIHPNNSLLVAKNQILVGYLSTLFPKLGIFDLNYGTLKDLIIRIIFKHEIMLTLDLDDETGMDDVDINIVRQLTSEISLIQSEVEKQMRRLEETPLYSSYFTYIYDSNLSTQENIGAIIGDLEEEIKYQKDKLDQGATGSFEARCQDNIKNIRKLIKEMRKILSTVRVSTFPALLKKFGIKAKDKLGYREAIIFSYLYSEVFGLGKFKRFEYCVVDEGQDFSVLEYLLLNQLVIKGRFNILGDLNQSYLKTGLKTWETINEIITETKECKKFELTTNYRSTKPIIDYACEVISRFSREYLPESINRKGPDVIHLEVSENTTSILFEKIDYDIKNLDKSVGIICFDSAIYDTVLSYLENSYRKILKDRLVILNPRDRILYTPKGVYLTMFENCKGLEFAKVYVLGMNKTPVDLHEAKKNYVAVTRAMNELVVFYK